MCEIGVMINLLYRLIVRINYSSYGEEDSKSFTNIYDNYYLLDITADPSNKETIRFFL